MADDGAVRRLGELGLTQNEARVYVALLRGGEPTAAEVAAAAAVPRPKVYEALGALEGRGFCRGSAGRVRRFRAVDPATALAGWVALRDRDREAAAHRDQAVRAELEALLPRPEASSPVGVPDFIEAISGRNPTTVALEDVIGRARDTLWEMLQPPFLQPRSRWNRIEADAARRGVDVRVVYTPDAVAEPGRVAGIVAAGGQARVAEQLPMKLLIRDGEEALISLRDAQTGAQSVTSARVRHPDLVAPLATLFTQVWEQARPLPGA
jgi:sugar-specific transcriptional regulator TrmB